jgi:tetratricopeptide (TPR) repeat protein
MFNLTLMLELQGKLAEAESTNRQAIDMFKKSLGGEHPYVANGLQELGQILTLENKLSEAETASREALALHRKTLGNEHPYTANSLDTLTILLLREDKPAEAEVTARECLAIRQKQLPNEWVTFDTRVKLGGCLTLEKKYAEAGPLILEGYQGLKEREATMPPTAKGTLPEAIETLVQFYEATHQPEEAAKWKAKLSAPDNPPGSPPR